jgi:hypothetical protein
VSPARKRFFVEMAQDPIFGEVWRVYDRAAPPGRVRWVWMGSSKAEAQKIARDRNAQDGDES